MQKLVCKKIGVKMQKLVCKKIGVKISPNS